VVLDDRELPRQAVPDPTHEMLLAEAERKLDVVTA